MTLSGLTGTFSIGADLNRNVTELDIVNLRRDRFVKVIVVYSTQ